jgi:hypothetical protein
MQTICALLIFQTPEFPASIDQLSPWLEMRLRRRADVHEMYERQTNRRFIKSHTPLDGLPTDDRLTYICVGRDPRDVAVSYEHHADNMDFDHFLELRAAAVGNDDLADFPPREPLPDDPLERFRLFVTDETVGGRPNLASVLHHLNTGWQRRHDRNVALFHYADCKTDLTGELLRLSRALDIPSSPERARALVPEASLARMRERASELAPEASFGNWKDVQGFFRSGGTGEWRARLTPGDLAAYDARVAGLVEADLAAWAHGGRLASGVDPDR